MQAKRTARSGLLSAGLCILAFFALGSTACGKAGGEAARVQKITVACAASMTDLMEEAGKAFTDKTGIAVEYEFGSSGALARKISADSPTDILVSADRKWTQYLEGNALADPGGSVMIARNALVCVAPESAQSLPAGASDLLSLKKIALGDPEHVPAGNYARQALQNLGAWDILRDQNKMVLSQDVRAVLTLVEQDQVDAGIVYSTDARVSRKVKAAFTFAEQTHDPVEYYAVAVKSSPRPEAAKKFIEYLRSQEFSAILDKYGFSNE